MFFIFQRGVKERWSEQRDSNSRPSGPKPDALPGCAMLRTDILNIAMKAYLFKYL